MSGYFTEDTQSLPFDVLVKLYQRDLSYPFAAALVTWQRFRKWTGRLGMPLTATRWQDDVQWADRKDMPGKALARWAPRLEVLNDRDFDICGWVVSDTLGPKQEANVYLRHASGRVFAQLLWLTQSGIEQTTASMITYRSGGNEVMTTAIPFDQHVLCRTLTPTFIDVECLPAHTSIRKLMQVHGQRLKQLEIKSLSTEEFFVHFQQQRIRLFEHFVTSGAFRKLADGEVRYLAAE